ncbi:MAG TPA: circularly permuted type 2 ATP-grasp protein [Vicinamibacterales bacterium]
MTDPAAAWNAILRVESDADLCGTLADRMRAGRLTFGGRLLCPFLRPFFLHPRDEGRVARASEALWRLGERLAAVAPADPALMRSLGMSDAEMALAAIEPGPGPASTAGRADAFLLPDSLEFAEYNAESPAGAAYSQRLSELFDSGVMMARFRQQFEVRYYTPVDAIRAALLQTWAEWSGTHTAPRMAIVDWREVPTWSEFELLRDAFTAAGIETSIHDPRDLTFDGSRLYGGGRAIDFVYRRVLINDIVARPDECRALVDAYRAGAVCVANNLRCKIPHKKAFFAVLTDERYAHLFDPADLDAVRAHVPWTRMVDGKIADDVRGRREDCVLKPNDEYGGTGVMLGWESTGSAWDAALQSAVADGGWIAQRRIAVRREPFPVCDGGTVVDRDMLVDFAPYLFRGRVAGFLTRLSASGLANVTSGGGQVPAFVVQPRDIGPEDAGFEAGLQVTDSTLRRQ